MIYHLYIYHENQVEDLRIVFEQIHEEVSITMLKPSILKVTIHLSYDEELVDFKLIHASILNDFNLEVVIVVMKNHSMALIDENLIIGYISNFSRKLYGLHEVMDFFSHVTIVKNRLKRILVSLLGQEYVNTIRMIAKSNLNLSVTSKKLFVHRNTLNYRIERMIELIDIDVRNFFGLKALIGILDD